MEGMLKGWANLGLLGSLAAGFVAIILLIAGLCAIRESIKRFFQSSMGEGPANGPGAPTAPASPLRGLLRWGAFAVLAVCFLVGSAACIFIAVFPYQGHWGWIAAYSFVFLIGGSVGAAELVSRYRDKPTRALLTAPAVFYMSLNAFGSVAALALIYVFREKLGFASTDSAHDWADNETNLVSAVLLAGFSSLVFFRSSIFKFRAGDSDFPIGPSIVLDALLGAADRAVDRVMAEPRATFVNDLMRDIAFDKAVIMLPGLCIALMQNLSSEESQRIAGVVNKLRSDKETPNKIKTLNLGLELLTVVGETVLQTAVRGLGGDLQDSTAKLVQEVTSVMASVSFERARRTLPSYCFALWPNDVPSDAQQKLLLDLKALSELTELPDEYKSLLLGIRLARLTDGDTLRKAVNDLGAAIKAQPAPSPPPPPAPPPQPPQPPPPPGGTAADPARPASDAGGAGGQPSAAGTQAT